MRRREFVRSAAAALAPALLRGQGRRRNIVFILCDDHRFDAIGALGHPWLAGQTPHLDRMVREGVHFRNAFVTSSLCSPSRASLLTGLYMHAHRVMDNFSPLNPKLATFPQMLQQAGYRCGFIGKWHMGGDSDEPRPGFDHWLSFPGQGEYINPPINRNGARSRETGYVTDLLTQEAMRFIRAGAGRPFLLYLSHKAVHHPFQPPERHSRLFQGLTPPYPASMKYVPEIYGQWPDWVRRRRYSRHGVDGLLGQTSTFDEYYRGYMRSLISVDESVGSVLSQLEDSKLLNDTLVVYMGDNGYMWGEHGLVDKRAMYEPSIRVPLLMRCPDLFGAGTAVDGMALNLDLAPTFLDAAGVRAPEAMHGRSLLRPATGKAEGWRTDFVYEYEWEQDFPYTPTIIGLRTGQHSLMQYYGIWDIPELYDNRKDPEQLHNLLAGARITLGRGRYLNHVKDPEVRTLVERMQTRLAEILRQTGGDPRLSGKGSEGDRLAL